jgi:hypothetical protein
MVMASSDIPLTAFTLGEFENREIRIARRVAVTAGGKHVFLKRGLNHYPDMVQEAVAIGDGMQRFDHAHVIGVLEDIRQHCDVLLDGYGFDARLKGVWAIEQRASLLGRSFSLPRLRNIADEDTADVWAQVRSFRQLPAFSELFHAPYRETARDVVVASLEGVLQSCPADHPQDRIAYPMASSFRSIGGYLMVQATRAHMAQRSVIFDNNLLELSLRIPPELRSRGRVLKKALSRLSPTLATIPDANTGLRADLPVWIQWPIVSSRTVLQDAGLLSPPRLPSPAYANGSWPHWGELIRYNTTLRTMIEDTLHNPACLDPGLFDIQQADSILTRHLERQQDSARMLFALLTFGQWHKRYGPQ